VAGTFTARHRHSGASRLEEASLARLLGAYPPASRVAP
jgi:hypothetical protein